VNATVFHAGRHLSPEELYDHARTCPICLRERAGRVVMRVQRSPDVELLECENCGGCSTSSMPRPEILADFYRSYYDSSAAKTTYDDVSRLGRHIEGCLRPNCLGDCPRILDFGGGDGALAVDVAQRLLLKSACLSAEICVVDFHQPRSAPHPKITIACCDSLEKVSGQFDLVIASAVLEHIPEVNPVFRRLISLVRAGGWFYARTPYVAPFAFLPFKMDFTFPGHVHDLGPRFWDRVLETFSLKGEILRSAPSPVETILSKHFFRTIAAAALRFPARLECRLRSPGSLRRRGWNLVGGWEILLRI
jgi:SAM-dependent methyltransferase